MEWMYECFITGTNPKGLLRRTVYNLWLLCGIRPSALTRYMWTKQLLEDHKAEE